VNYPRRQLCKFASAFIVATFPFAVDAAVWTIVPSVETGITYTDNFLFAAKGNEADETVLEVIPSIRAQSSEGPVQGGINYGIDNLFYAHVPDRNSSQQLLRGYGSAELFRDLFFVNATGMISHQAITPAAASNVGALSVSLDSTEVSTWNVSPYFQQTIGGMLVWRAGVNLNVVNYKALLPDSFSRESFFSASSGPGAEDLHWTLDIKVNDTYYSGQLSDVRHESAEMGLRYKFLPEWAVTGRLGYADYKYQYVTVVDDEPRGKIWRVGAAWLPSARTELEVGISRHVFGRSKYGSFAYTGRRLFCSINTEEVVTNRRQLQTDYRAYVLTDPQTHLPIINPETQSEITVYVPFLTETEEIFVNKINRIRTGIKSDEISISFFGYHDHRRYQTTSGTEKVSGEGVTTNFVLSRRTSLEANINQSNVISISALKTETTDMSASVLRTFGTGVKGSINIQRREGSSTDILLTHFVAYSISTRVVMDF